MLKNVNITKDIISVHWEKLCDFFVLSPQKLNFLLKWEKNGGNLGKNTKFSLNFPSVVGYCVMEVIVCEALKCCFLLSYLKQTRKTPSS